MANGYRLSDMEYDEVSLVTRPANQLSKVVLFKSDGGRPDSSDPTGKRMKSLREMRKEGSMTTTDVDEYISTLEKANEELFGALEKANKGFPPKKGAKMSDEEDDPKEKEGDDDEDDILKSADPRVVELLKSAEARANAAEAIAKAEQERSRERAFIEKAATDFQSLPATAEVLGTVLKSAADHLDEVSYDTFVEVLGKADHMISTGEMLEEVGKSGVGASGYISKLDQAASAVLNNEPTLTREQAIEKAVMADPTLYTNREES